MNKFDSIYKMESLNIDALSFWERSTYFENIDFLIVGAGIVGYTTAIELKKKHKNAKVLIVERGILPAGASTKNAGFACFGSPSELIADLNNQPSSTVFETVQERWEGLIRLKELVGTENMAYEQLGSWDLLRSFEKEKAASINEQLPFLNDELKKITDQKNTYSVANDCFEKFGFKDLETSFYNRLEGQIDTGKLNQRLHALAIEAGVLCLFGTTIHAFQLNLYNVGIQSSFGYFKTSNLIICTNGFAQSFFPHLDVNPARAQVIVTTPINDLKIKGTFHFDDGYYYFRNIGNRILLGGGRNLNLKGENTTDLQTTQQIIEALKVQLSSFILPQQPIDIEYEWAGIMGVGLAKRPIIESIDPKIAVGVRMGGMGVAIGASVGKKLADLF